MKIKKSKTKIIVLSVCSVLAIIGFWHIRVELYHRINDPNKERIFEIEDCAHNRKVKFTIMKKNFLIMLDQWVFMIRIMKPDTINLIYEFLDAYDYKNEMKSIIR
ncbi:MAG: hypothetical protein V8T30_08100 [Ruminococcus sp.]